MAIQGFERPETVVMAVVGVVFGVGLSFWLLPAEWGFFARLGAGLALGVTALLSLFANRMIGGSDFE